ncbi:MAG: hypothetical protein QM602_12015 [Microbacterium sp.]
MTGIGFPVRRSALRALLSTAVALLVISGVLGMHAHASPASAVARPAAGMQAEPGALHSAHAASTATSAAHASPQDTAPAPIPGHACPACADDTPTHTPACGMAASAPLTLTAAAIPAQAVLMRSLPVDRTIRAVRAVGESPPSLQELSISRT